MSDFHIPPIQYDAEGQPRKVGFELELGNLTVEQVAQALASCFGGDIHKRSAFEMFIEGSALGKIKVERDTQTLTSLKYREWLENLGVNFKPGSEGDFLEKGVDKLSSWVVPCEIVTQPLSFDQFVHLNKLVEVLEQLEGQGTQSAIFYAFGLHLNPSAPDLTAPTLLAYLQATLLLVDWIIEDAETDFSRRFLTSYIDPFPHAYAHTILTLGYRPTLEELIDDYMIYNNTRNRPLDMLPIFCMIDSARVNGDLRADEQRLVKGRPAFHYRLPDCRVGEFGWSIADEWNRWNLIEQLAADHEKRRRFISAWQHEQKHFKWMPGAHWVKRVGPMIKEHLLSP